MDLKAVSALTNRQAIIKETPQFRLTKHREKQLYAYFIKYKKLFTKKHIGFQGMKKMYREMDDSERAIVDAEVSQMEV